MKTIRVVVVLLTLVVGLSVLATGYSLWSKTLTVEGMVETGDVDIAFTHFECSDGPGELDLGTDPPKDVGSTTCTAIDTDGDGDYDVLQIVVNNAYPGYQLLADIEITSTGSVPVHITDTALVFNSDPVALALEGFWTDNNLICVQLHQGDSISGSIWMQVKQEAQQNTTYTFQIAIEAAQWNEAVCNFKDLGGTIGLWSNWDSHNTYTADEIEGWLSNIDTASDWHGPTTVAGMESVFRAGHGGTMEEKFLAHYLATRLDAESGRLALLTTHDVTSYDPSNYLGLANPSAATLAEIISAIESKHGTSPTNNQFEVMKDICDALNNLEA